MRPIIGVTTQTLQAIDGIPPGLPASVVMNQRYYDAVADAGGAPILIPLFDDATDVLRGVYDVCDGILIPGGVDMHPACFGEAPHERLGRTDQVRDRVELQLTRWAIDNGKPLLGLCRGLQVINVALGGTLYQDLGTERAGSIRHDYFPTHGYTRDYLAHEVALHSGTRLFEAMGRDRIAVNSMHHQGIKDLSPTLVPAATAPDGLVEGVEGPGDQYLVGVQWHPEVFESADAHTRRLFESFLAASRTFRDRSVARTA